MTEELTGVSRVRVAENDGGGRHGGGGFTSKIRPRVAGVDLVGPPVSGHILRPLPAVVVSVSISNLNQTQFVTNREHSNIKLTK